MFEKERASNKLQDRVLLLNVALMQPKPSKNFCNEHFLISGNLLKRAQLKYAGKQKPHHLLSVALTVYHVMCTK